MGIRFFRGKIKIEESTAKMLMRLPLITCRNWLPKISFSKSEYMQVANLPTEPIGT